MALKYLPNADSIKEAADLEVFNIKGDRVILGSLFESQKVVLVFIRHFFCGNCQDYVAHLATVRQDALEQANTKIIVIGCGEWQPIESYHEVTGFQGPIYADPSRAVYHALGMTIETLGGAPADQPKPSYLGRGSVSMVLRSLWRGPMKNPSHIGKSGPIAQLGGEFVFGPGRTCSFASHMQNTQDHVEVPDLMKAAGVPYP